MQAGEKCLYPIKPVATRWNTIEAMMEREVCVRSSMNAAVTEEGIGTYRWDENEAI
jgi:hypothetical protein